MLRILAFSFYIVILYSVQINSSVYSKKVSVRFNVILINLEIKT